MGFPYPMRAKLAERLERAQTVTTRRPTSASDDLAGRYGGPRARIFFCLGVINFSRLRRDADILVAGSCSLDPGARFARMRFQKLARGLRYDGPK